MNQDDNSLGHLPSDWFEGLVSPRTSDNLHLSGNSLVAANTDERFEVNNRVARLLSPELTDETLVNELNAMEGLPVYGVSYFNQEFLHFISQELHELDQKSCDSNFNMIEIGGGDGQFARHFLRFDQSRIFVADIAEKFLKLAPDKVRKVCCDARYPYFEKNKLDLAVFWVSFHHLTESDQKKAVAVAVNSLKPNGILAFFEPNSFFLPRHIILNTFLRKHVYFDDEEKPVNYMGVRNSLEGLGMKEVYTRFIQPPYSWKFIEKLKFGGFYYFAVKFLYFLDRFFLLPIANLVFGKSEKRLEKIRRYSASYFFSVFRK
ncbi:MAG: methyltransferase domain-containing protein [Nitrospina sp.]|nr:methyltransferase domain-containing protein [Nitrospina sp.]MBT3874443.1 methyltransferase domain-containing protein [Nitrospina sp.]MBT4049075.1 methyltransferase domain-containing protein [Nitrospina sp.]MBT4559113.1 methyltransferase domain-containing protein [Nitrospina sp.]MBT5347779.1 methyltransferase domain-containing protein [Nitrospina sp.]